MPKPAQEPPKPPAPRKPTHPALPAILSALLLALSYEPVGAWWLAWVALVPLMALVRSDRHSTGKLALGAWAGGLVFWLIAVEWVRKSDPDAWPGWLALALVLSAWWPMFFVLARVAVRGLGVPLMIAGPAVWLALEFVRAYQPLNGFHWFYLAHSQHRLSWLIQVSDLAGAWGLTFLVALVNAWIVNLLTLPLLLPTPKGPRLTRPQAVRLAIVFFALAGSLIYGAIRTTTATFRPGPRLALLQSDIPQNFQNPPTPELIATRFRALVSEAAATKPDLIVWPETFFPVPWIAIDPALAPRELARQIAQFDPEATPADWITDADRSHKLLRQWTDLTGVPTLFGVNSHQFRPGGKGFHNTALLVLPGSDAFQAYDKIHLVPFGEYVPLVQTFPAVLRLTPFSPDHMPNLRPGRAPTSFRLGDWRFATVICFEDSVPQIPLASVRAGDRQPDFLLNTSNDGWFRGTAAHELHLANSVLRAVELRVPVARAVNTGISALIDGNGRVLAQLGPAREGVLTVAVPLDDRSSLYVATGPWLPWLCLLLTLAAPPLAFILRLRRRRGASGAAGATDKPAGATSSDNLPATD